MGISTAERISRYMAAHPGATVKEARGHGSTPEHGRVSAPVNVGGRQVSTTRSTQAAQKLINSAAKGGGRVSVTIVTKDGKVHEVFASDKGGHKATGMTAKYLAEQVKASGGSLRGYLASTYVGGRGYGKGRGKKEVIPANEIAAIQITEY